MARQMRLFIAIPLSRRLLETGGEPLRGSANNSASTVLSNLRSLGRPVKAVAIETVHVTLKFVGDVDAELVSDITQVVEQVAATESPFELQLQGLGAFPTRERPSVIWVGLKNSDACSRMATELESRLVPLGIPAESRPFRPHLTVARIKGRSQPPSGLFELVTNEQSTSFGGELVRSLELIRSDLKPDGPKHSTLAAARLAAP